MKKYLFLIGLLLLMPFAVNADSKIDISTSKTNVKVDDSITVYVDISSNNPIGYYEYTLDYDYSKLKLISGSDYNVNRPNNSTTKEIGKSFKFKVLANGTSKITVKAYAVMDLSDKNMKVDINPATISTYSSDNTSNSSSSSTQNYLSSLEIEGYQISPKFDKETTDYKLVIDKNVSEIKIIAEALDENSEIDGDGTVKIEPGENKLEVSVRNENGEKKIYNILVTVNEDGGNLEKELVFDEVKLILMKAKDVPFNYTKYKAIINETEVDCYKLQSDSDYCLIYGMNAETNDEGWYSYNQKENTIQKYNDSIDEYYDNKIKDTEILIYILGSTSLLFGIIVIILAVKLNHRKRKLF